MRVAQFVKHVGVIRGHFRNYNIRFVESLKDILQNNSRATITRKLERSDGVADWSLSARELARRQRAFTPWPGLFTRWQGKSLRLVEVAALEEPAHSSVEDPKPGKVVDVADADIPVGISTADGILGMKTLQLAGRRASPAAEFLRGYPDFVGSSL